jgi:hypothetical protein
MRRGLFVLFTFIFTSITSAALAQSTETVAPPEAQTTTAVTTTVTTETAAPTTGTVATTTAAPESPKPSSIATAADDPNAAVVYVYRPKAFVGWALHPTLMVDGKDLVNIANGTMWSGHFTPGHYVFQMDDKQSGAELDLKSGETYYMKIEIVTGFWKGGGKMTLMAREQGGLEVKALKPLPEKEVEHPDFKKH